MKLSTCPKGHFYDADKYASCPYCVPQDEAEAVTEALNVTMEDFSTRAPSTGASAAGAVQQMIAELHHRGVQAALCRRGGEGEVHLFELVVNVCHGGIPPFIYSGKTFSLPRRMKKTDAAEDSPKKKRKKS